MRKRNAFILGTVLLVALLVSREAGVVDLHWTSTSTTSSFQAEHWNDARFAKLRSASVRVEFDARSPDAKPDSVLAAPEAQPTNVVVYVEPYEIEGWRWLPLYKTGSCSYRAKVVRDGEEWGKFEGSVDLSVKGLAPSRYVRESLREEVRKRVSDTVNHWVSK